MSELPLDRAPDEAFDTPDALLDVIRDRLDWTAIERAEALDRLVAMNPADQIRHALARPGRLAELGGPHGEAVLLLLANFGTPELFEAFATVLESRTCLPPEWAWASLRVLGGTAALTARPGLANRLEELSAADDGPENAHARWTHKIESVPEDINPATRGHGCLGLALPSAAERALAVPRPLLKGTLVTALDDRGIGHIAVRSRRAGGWVAAAFTCDVFDGVLAVRGMFSLDSAPVWALFTELASQPDLDVVEDEHGLALGLLAGSILLGVQESELGPRYWIEQTLGPDFRPRRFTERDSIVDPELTLTAAHALFDASPGWLDRSALTRELAEEWSLREPGAATNPVRDSGLVRFLFERRLLSRVELDRRRLAWMAAFWQATGADDLARLARTAAVALSETANLVPGHPFFTALAVRSLTAAIESPALRILPHG